MREADDFITTLPMAKHDGPEWQAATEELILVVGARQSHDDGPIGVMRVLNRSVERVFERSRIQKHWRRH